MKKNYSRLIRVLRLILSRINPTQSSGTTSDDVDQRSHGKSKESNLIPSFNEFVNNRDYIGILTLIEYNHGPSKNYRQNELWRAFCYFRLGEYRKSLEIYSKLKHLDEDDMKGGEESGKDRDVELFQQCCRFYLGEMIDEKVIDSYQGPHQSIAKRLRQFQNLKSDSKDDVLVKIQAQLSSSIEDQLCMASIHFNRNQYQEAIDIYKKILLEEKSYLALNVYIALCYYLLDYYDVSQEVLSLYLQKHPKSIIATNLKACNNYRLYNGSMAEVDLRNLIESFPPNFNYAKDFIRHNLVVFLNGEGAFQILPSLMNQIPEARLNLVIYYLRNDKTEEAEKLMRNIEPKTTIELVLKAIINANIGQTTNSIEHLRLAQKYFQTVGSSPTECDTILGRQCMASYFFLQKQFEEVILYLSSIKSYFYNDDAFNFNNGQAKMMINDFKEAEEAFLMIESEQLRKDLIYICCLTRCCENFKIKLNLKSIKFIFLF
ncbi:tetratricopeptide repeat protein 26-like protein [Sarcoptes scabiei]|uniref:Tetratricopeptide repeat protein 26-like protein n=1 Tax=Sarcoptes scabiei TaxID=52283 RepID=A0A132AFP5_SARSC|nr:tetratricopeptide repeat protein 26-like protein [Sarcoptes scabiei]